jgi:hypothetical protein
MIRYAVYDKATRMILRICTALRKQDADDERTEREGVLEIYPGQCISDTTHRVNAAGDGFEEIE